MTELEFYIRVARTGEIWRVARAQGGTTAMSLDVSYGIDTGGLTVLTLKEDLDILPENWKPAKL